MSSPTTYPERAALLRHASWVQVGSAWADLDSLGNSKSPTQDWASVQTSYELRLATRKRARKQCVSCGLIQGIGWAQRSGNQLVAQLDPAFGNGRKAMAGISRGRRWFCSDECEDFDKERIA